MSRVNKSILLALGAALAAAPFAAARVESQLSTPDKRHLAVEKAAQVARQVKPAALPAAISIPFAPPGFDLTDAEEAAAAAAAARLANPNGPAPVLETDRQLLTEIASKVRPNGTVSLNDRPLLMIGRSFVKTGSHFTVTYKGNDYDLELTQIDGSNFTLHYKNEEITRPILEEPAKSP